MNYLLINIKILTFFLISFLNFKYFILGKGFILYDYFGNIIISNSKAEKIFQYNKNELIGKNYLDSMPKNKEAIVDNLTFFESIISKEKNNQKYFFKKRRTKKGKEITILIRTINYHYIKRYASIIN